MLYLPQEKPVPLPLYMPALFVKERHSQQLESNKLGATWRSWIYSVKWDWVGAPEGAARAGRCETTTEKPCSSGRSPMSEKRLTFYLALRKVRRSTWATVGRSTSPHGLERSWSIFSFPNMQRTRRQSETAWIWRGQIVLDSPYCCVGLNDLSRGWGRAVDALNSVGLLSLSPIEVSFGSWRSMG